MTIEELKFEIAKKVFAQIGLPNDSLECRQLQDEIEDLKNQLKNCNTEEKQLRRVVYYSHMKNNTSMTRKFHPTKTYNMKPWRAEKMQIVNRLVRGGCSYKQIARMLNTSTTTVARYHVGYADNCLPREDGGYFHWSRDPRSVMYLGACCDI